MHERTPTHTNPTTKGARHEHGSTEINRRAQNKGKAKDDKVPALASLSGPELKAIVEGQKNPVLEAVA